MVKKLRAEIDDLKLTLSGTKFPHADQEIQASSNRIHRANFDSDQGKYAVP